MEATSLQRQQDESFMESTGDSHVGTRQKDRKNVTVNGSMTSIDLNSDMGESFGRWTLGDDRALLDTVSSANVACGFHAGDPTGILRTVTNATENGVSIGAHVAYHDIGGFGRRFVDVQPRDLKADVMYQLSALRGLAASAGTSVSYVKPHGALYNRIVFDEQQAQAVVDAITAIDPSLGILTLPGSVVGQIARQAGLRVFIEAFADRAYTPEGHLVPRTQPGAVLTDVNVIAERIARLVQTGTLEALDGSVVQVHADSVCVHGDTPGAVEVAKAVKAKLINNGVRVAPFNLG